MSQEFKSLCQAVRGEIELLKKTVCSMMDMVVECGLEDMAECRANIKIAYRHLEDARMRLGKAIQAADGGVSIYDKGKINNTKIPDRALSADEVKGEYDKPVVANEKGDDD